MQTETTYSTKQLKVMMERYTSTLLEVEELVAWFEKLPKNKQAEILD